MRRTYRAPQRRYLVYVVIVLCGIYYYCTRPSGVVERCASYALYPLLCLQRAVVDPVKDYYARKHTLQELSTSLQNLEQEKEKLLAENIQLHATCAYARDIAEVVTFKQQYTGAPAHLVQILVKNISEQEHSILINAGQNQGVTRDMVAVYNNMLLGKVVDVYPQYSKVLLITDRSCKVAACCVTTGASGIHEGANGATTTLQYVSHLETVQPDDMILSTGDGLVFPKGFALGRVARTATEGVFHNVSVAPLIDVRTIKYCYLLAKGAQLTVS